MDRILLTAAVQQAVVVANQEYNYINMFRENSHLDPEVLERIGQFMLSETIPKLENFYERVIPSYNLSTFKADFRMTPSTFEFILQQVANCPEFQKRDRVEFGGKDQVTIEKALLIAIWTLATPNCYRSIGKTFGVCPSTVHSCLHTMVDIILKYLCKVFLKWPSEEERVIISLEFGRYGLTNVIGAIDGCHIPIKMPSVHGEDYFNRKKFYSMVLQAICHNLMFTDVDIRWPGGVHDARVFRNSDIYAHGSELCNPNYYIVGDAAYPCKNWVVPPFRDNGHLTLRQQYFNTQLSKTRVKIEQAFALLLGRFRRLKEFLDMNSVDRIVKTVVACSVLHNICIFQGDDDIQEFIMAGRENLVLVNLNPNGNADNPPGFARRNLLVDDLWNRHHPN